MGTPGDTDHAPRTLRVAVVRPPSSPELTVLILDEQTEAPVRVIAFDRAGRATSEAYADCPGEDELWPAIGRVANLTPEEAQELEAQALAVLDEPQEADEETGSFGVVSSLMIAAALVYLVLLPIVGAGTIVRWLW